MMNDKFKIVCIKYKGEDICIEEKINYDWNGYDEFPYVDGYSLECSKCGNRGDLISTI